MLVLLAPGVALGQRSSDGPAWEETLPADRMPNEPGALLDGLELTPASLGVAPGPVLEAFNAVRTWMDTGRAPATFELDGAEGWHGARVTLRFGTQTLGRGRALAPEGGDAGALLIEAVEACRAEMRKRAPFAHDDLLDAKLTELARVAALELEIAASPIALDDAAVARPMERLSPGLDGVMVRIGERHDAFFPGELLQMSMAPDRAMGALVARLTGEPTLGLLPAERLAAREGAVFHRFRSTHVAQARSGDAPRFLHRGGRVVELASIDEAALELFGERLAAHLAERLRGSARADEQSAWLAAIALQRRTREGQPVSAEVAAMLRGVREGPPANPAARALAAIAWLRAGEAPAWVGETIAGWNSDDGFEALGVGQRAIALWAIAEAAGRDPKIDRAAARERLIGLLDATPEGRLVSLMPFAGWAAAGLARDGEEPMLARFAGMRRLVWDHQLEPTDVDVSSRDLVGGIAYTGAGPPTPTWHTARPVAFLASVLFDGRFVTEDERLLELGRVTRSLRFLRQLAVDEAAWSARGGGASGWGVRASLWDASQPMAASALTLIAVDSTLGASSAMGVPDGAGGGAETGVSASPAR